jgi:uncharacterized membrane protein YeaQ/YmgE (transglycosylase-associated protein family)
MEAGTIHGMWILWSALIGLVIGAIARLFTPGRTPQGFFVTIAIGFAGSMIATIGGRLAGWYRGGESAGFLASVLGAIVLLLIIRAISDRG